MFSRRHPYLFFLLIFSSIAASTLIFLTIVFLGVFSSEHFGIGNLGGEKVGVIQIDGIIVDAKGVISSLKRFRNNKSIKAIVLRINSPGGGVGPSQEIFREVRKTIKHKKVITSMGAIAASGGYYIAAGTDGIMANPGTITGSIGVIMGFTNYQKLFEKIGLTPVVVKSGEFKDIGSPARKMTMKESEILHDFADQIHRQFIKDVAMGRKMDIKAVETIADGRILTGNYSKEIGLVDRIGNFEDAVEWAGRLGGIKGEVLFVYDREKKFSIISLLFGNLMKDMMRSFSQQSLNPSYLCNLLGFVN